MAHTYWVDTVSGATDSFTRIDEARKFAKANCGGNIYRDYDESDNAPEIFEAVTDDSECESCLVVGEHSKAINIRNGEKVCEDCAAEIDYREYQEKGLREAQEANRG
jgi:hypothetical protein